MGQYFKLVNADKNEYVDLPSGMKLIERVTNPIAMGMIGMLLFEGPCDGTVLVGRGDPDAEHLQEAIDERIELEKEREEKRFKDYLSGERDYVRRKFERETGKTPEEAPAEFEDLAREESWSTYRKDNLQWDRKKLTRVAIANLDIDEFTDYIGRWAGDDVRLVGDYADNSLYGDTQENWRYEYEGEEFVNHATGSAPVVPSSIERDDIMHSTEERDVEPGDLCYVSHPETGDSVYAHFVEVADSEWENITDGVTHEFYELVGESWIKKNKDMWTARPDMVINA